MANMTDISNETPFSLQTDKFSTFGTTTYNIVYKGEQYGELVTAKLAQRLVKVLNQAHKEGIKEGNDCIAKKVQYKAKKPYILMPYTGPSAEYSFSIKYRDTTVMNFGRISILMLNKMLDTINYAFNQGAFTITGKTPKVETTIEKEKPMPITHDRITSSHKPLAHEAHDYIKK